MKSHLQSYPCPLQINSFWNLGFLLGITIILQIITGIFLGLHYANGQAYEEPIFPFINLIFATMKTMSQQEGAIRILSCELFGFKDELSPGRQTADRKPKIPNPFILDYEEAQRLTVRP